VTSVTLGSGRATSRLGFGGAVLLGGVSSRRSLRLLDAALVAGITHFDVAPAYGFGMAEDVLGAFLRSRRGAVTVATKVGLPRPRAARLMTTLRAATRPFLGRTQGLRRSLSVVAHRATAGRARFELHYVQDSVKESLRRLQTDHVDVLLLHEATLEDVSDELQRFLDDAVQKGMVGSYGIGSPRAEAEALTRVRPELARVLQTNWSAGDRPISHTSETCLITHGAFRKLAQLSDWLREEPDRLDRYRALVGDGVADDASLADLMLSAALAQNPHGIVLVGTRRADRIVRSAAICADPTRLASGARLAEALAAELDA
jgi:D-threo-aldose 1-dehydrogenase